MRAKNKPADLIHVRRMILRKSVRVVSWLRIGWDGILYSISERAKEFFFVRFQIKSYVPGTSRHKSKRIFDPG